MMTSVLPPWKLELIEKKRKRLEEEKAKEKQKEDIYSNIPEWKRSILSKRKVGQAGEDFTVHNDDKPSLNAASIQKDRIYSPNSLKKSQRSSEEDGPRLYVESSSKTSENLQNGNRVEQHSFVANSLSLADKQREDVEQPVKLSNSTNCKKSTKSTNGEESRVYYEHIRTPSELRKRYELKVAREKTHEAQQCDKELPSRKRSNSESLGGDDKECPSNATEIHSLETPNQKPASTECQTNGTLPKDDNDTVNIIPTQRKITFSQEDSLLEAPALNEINQQDANEMVIHKDESKKELQNGGETSPEVHVYAIRNKFGPSGFFRRRSISSDNLLNSFPDQTPPSSRPKAHPSPLNKRWSMVSLSRNNSTDDEGSSPPKSDHGTLQRARSMTDMRVEHPHEPPIHLRHRASVSHDIEHRIHELLHHLSISDGNSDDEYDNDDHIFNEIKTQHTPAGREANEEPCKERRASWSEDKASVPSSLHITLDEKPLSTSDKPISDQKSHKILIEENKEPPHQKPAMKLEHSAKQEEITIEKEDVHLQNSELYDNQETLKSNSDNTANSEELDDKAKSPSVHKLSALFGSSILKGNKKTKENKKSEKKNNAKLPKQETKTENKKNESKENSKSRKFPWTKKGNDNKKEISINQSTKETKFPFEGSQGLKPIQKKYVEHKITGNMTLVLGTDNYSKIKTNQTYNHLKTPASHPNSLSPASKQSKNIPESPKNKQTTSIDYNDECITIIDVPYTTSHDIEVSAIDIPESPSPTPVSVIDMPEKQDSEVKVSVIDIPEESDSDDSDCGISGSYEVNPGAGPNVLTFESDDSESIDEEEDEEEDEEDDDADNKTKKAPKKRKKRKKKNNLPVSYVVVFETERENVKPCLRGPQTRKRKAKVIFHSEKLQQIHDYPSEQCLQYHFDEMEREKIGGLGKYQPSALKNVNLSLESLKPRESTPAKDENSNNQVKDNDAKITYSDDGEGFSSSSSSSGALLF